MIKIYRKKITLFVLCMFTFFIILTAFPGSNSNKKKGKELIEKGETQYKNLKWEEALQTFEEALEYIKNPQLYYNLAKTHYALGDNETAKEFLRKLFKIKPGFKIDKGNHTRLFMSTFNQVKNETKILLKIRQKLKQ